MKRNFTILMAAFALMVSMMMPLGMKGQTNVTLFSETFNSCDGTGGNDGQWSGSIATSNIHTDNTGWSFTKESGAYQCAKFGSTSAKGKATTPSIPFSGNATLTFKAGAWNGSSEKTTLNLSTTDGTLKQNGNTISSVTMTKGAWTTYTIDIVGVTSSVQITFEGYQASNSRFFLDEIAVSQVAPVATPSFSPAAGTYNSTQNVNISCATSGATIHYTTDGSTPTESSPMYSGTIAVSSTTTIKAIAVKSGMTNSTVATATYTINNGTQYTVTFNPGNGTCSTTTLLGVAGSSITLPTALPSSSCADAGWTFVGWATSSVNETNTAPTLLTGSYTIHGNATLYAVYRVNSGSATTSETLNFSSGVYNSTSETITWTIPNVMSIKQERNGSSNSAPNSDYVSAPRWYKGNKITITPNTTINSISISANTENYATALANSTYSNASATLSETNVTITLTNGNNTVTIVMGGQSRLSSLAVNYSYGVYSYATSPNCMEQVASPTFSPAAGTYTEAQNVTLSCTTSGATIHYTTDGSTPTASSTTYSSAIVVSSTTTIKAIAVKEGMTNSAVAEATYTINIPTPYTITFNPGNGICTTASVTENSGTNITLPTATPSTTCADAGWTFAGWATSNVDFTTTAPTLYTDSYTITSSTTLYAVYKNGDGSGESFEYVFSEQGFSNAQEIFSAEMDVTSGIGWAATTGGSNTPKYYDTGKGLRVYNGGTFTITTNNNTITAVSLTFSGSGYTFNSNDSNPTTWSGDHSTNITWNVTQTCRLQKVNVTYGALTYTYATSPDCTDITVSESSLSFLYEGGAGSFDFTVSNPISGATASASTTESWITNVAVSGNTVSFQVAQNDGLARSGEITLTYAKNGTTLATASVTINQDSNPVLPGGADNPYTVAQAVDATPSSGTSDLVYVKGVVSQIVEIEVMQYHNARYYISDDGSTSSTQLLAFYGRNINNTDFLSEDELLVGDSVVICGQLQMYNDKAELGAGNYIVYLHRDIDPVTFSPVSCVTTSGTYVSLYSNVFDEWDAEIYYTTDGSEPSQSNGTYYDVWSDLITLTETTTIKAVAYVPDLDKYSSFTQATYTIVDPSMPGWVGNPYTVSQAIDAIDAASGNSIKGAYVRGTISRISQIELEQYFNATYFISDNGLEQNELQVYRGKYLSQGDFSSLDDIQVGDQVIVYGDLTLYNNTTHEFKPKNYIYDLQRSSSIIINQNHLDVDCNATAGTIAVSYSADLQVNIDIPTVQLCDAQGNAASYDWLSVSLNQDDEWNLEYAINANDGASQRTAYLKVSCQNVVSNLVTITQSEYQPDFATLPFTFDGGLAAAESTTGLKPAHLGSDYASSPKLKFNNPNVDGNITMSSLVLKINEVPGVLTYDIKGNVMEGGTFKVQESSNGITYSDVASYSGLANNLQSVTIDNLSPSTRYIRWIYVTKNKGNVGVGNIHLYKPIVNYNLVVNNPMDGETQIGAISANPAGPSIPAGTDVVLSISYDNNSYYFVEWVVTDDSDNPVAVTDNHFIMPAANVTVTATLVSVDTPCAFAFSVNGQMGDQQSGTVGNTIQMPECSNINFNGQTFIFLGWTTNANDIGNLLAVGSSFTLNQDVTFHAVFRQQVSGLEAEKHFAKVTRELQDWSGDYLIVYEDEDVAFNGSLQTLDAASNTVEVTISNGIIIASSDEVNSAKFTIAAVEGGYSIKSASGKYIGRGVNDNGMDESTEYGENYVNEISYNEEEGEIDIVGLDGAHLRFNSASNQNRFRYYKSNSYTGQKAIQLYKYVGSVNNLYTRIFMNETADNITIEGPSIIPDGSVLNVASITNNLGADRLLVDEGGQLVTSNSVNASVRKSITPYQQQEGKDNYYLVASPVDDLNPATAGMTDDNFDLYFFDQAFQGAEWRNYKAEDSDHYHFNLEAGKGYLYANDYGGFINMSGTMAATAADVTITKVSGKALSGWNLIGNPYPCNVTIDKPFYRLAEGGAVLATEATDNTVAIAPMEGVFVCADGTETMSFTKAPTTSTTDGRNLLSMSVSRSSKGRRVETDNAIVRFGEGAMLRKLVLNQELSQLYVAQEGTDYAIVNAEAEGELPVSFRAAANGSYTFSVAAEGVTMRYLHLIDHKTGTDVDLLQTPSYTFEASMGDFECRFKLVFACGDTNDGSETFAYYNGSQWMVSNEGKATLQVFDMMGRVLSSQNINGNAEVSIDRAAGVYLLRLIDGSDVKVQKIIIK